jgi:uncharacterized membrane protein YsdA (DUF1294 family)/cold shock CspA family protein
MAQRYRGKVVAWKADKGFGFIRPDHGTEDVFFHITSLSTRQREIAPNTPVFFTLAYDEQRRPRAGRVYLDNAPLGSIVVSLFTSTLFFVALAGLILLLGWSPWVFVVYLVMSALTFWYYAHDKQQAEDQRYRVTERWLHQLEALGGWPGALVAQAYFRHKTKKLIYQIKFWLMVLINVMLLGVYAYLVWARVL